MQTFIKDLFIKTRFLRMSFFSPSVFVDVYIETYLQTFWRITHTFIQREKPQIWAFRSLLDTHKKAEKYPDNYSGMGLDNGTGRTSVIEATRRRHLPTTWVVSTRQDRLFQEDCQKKCHESVICHEEEDEISFHTMDPESRSSNFLPQWMYMSKRSAWGDQGRIWNCLGSKDIWLPKNK